jgi:hypothetical protein
MKKLEFWHEQSKPIWDDSENDEILGTKSKNKMTQIVGIVCKEWPVK